MKLLKSLIICLLFGLIACDNDEIKPFVPLIETEEQTDGKTINYIMGPGLTQDNDGALWAGTKDNIYKFENQKWKVMTPDEDLSLIQTAFTDNNGNVWFNYLCYSNKKWKSYPELKKLDFRKIIQDKNDNIWFSGYNGRIVKFDGVEFQSFDADWTRDIAIDQNGILWFATATSLLKYDGKDWTTITREDGLPSLGARSIEIDNDNNIWIGGGVARVSMFNGIFWKKFEDDFLRFDVTDILCRKNGEIWVTIFEGEEYSYAIYDGAVWHPKKSNIRGLYRIFEDRDENIWFTTFLR